MGRVEGRKRGPNDLVGDLTPGDARAADKMATEYPMHGQRPPLSEELWQTNSE